MPKINKEFFIKVAQEASEGINELDAPRTDIKGIYGIEDGDKLDFTVMMYFRTKLYQKKFGDISSVQNRFEDVNSFMKKIHVQLPLDDIFNEVFVENDGKFSLNNEFNFEECDLVEKYGDDDLKEVVENHPNMKEIPLESYNPKRIFDSHVDEFNELQTKREEIAERDKKLLEFEESQRLKTEARWRKEQAGTITQEGLQQIFTNKNTFKQEYNNTRNVSFADFITNKLNNLDANSPVEKNGATNDEIHAYTSEKIGLYMAAKDEIASHGGFWKNLFTFKLGRYFKEQKVLKDMKTNIQEKHSISEDALNFVEKWDTDRGIKETFGGLSCGHIVMKLKTPEEVEAERQQNEKENKELYESIINQYSKNAKTQEEIEAEKLKEEQDREQRRQDFLEKEKANQEKLNELKKQVDDFKNNNYKNNEEVKQEPAPEMSTVDSIKDERYQKFLKLAEETRKKLAKDTGEKNTEKVSEVKEKSDNDLNKQKDISND